MHLITPETETSTHYNWGYVRNFALDDSAMMIQARQKNLDGGSVEGLMDINADNPPLQMRRIMDNLIAAEDTGP
jgi:hypothetical protein